MTDETDDDGTISKQRVEQQIVETQVVEQPVLKVIGLTGPTGEPGEPGKTGAPGDKQTTLDKWGLAIVVAVTALLALYFVTTAQHKLTAVSHAQAALDADQTAYAKQITCAQNLLHETIVALKARSQFGEVQAEATLQLDEAQDTYLATIVKPGATSTDQLTALATYRKALGFAIHATNDQLHIRHARPFPDAASVAACTS